MNGVVFTGRCVKAVGVWLNPLKGWIRSTKMKEMKGDGMKQVRVPKAARVQWRKVLADGGFRTKVLGSVGVDPAHA